MRELYQVRQIHPDVYQIMESGLDAMYLICQKDHAILIDTGTGTGDLREVISSITKAPVEVYLTHGHVDHFGGAGQFAEVWIAPKDEARARRVDAESRTGYVKRMIASGAAEPEVLERVGISDWPGNVKIHLIAEGQSAACESWKLDVYEVPGHTEGSLVYFDRSHNVIFSGDCANPIMVLRNGDGGDFQSHVARWVKKLKAVDQMINDDTLICAGHGVIDRSVWKQLIEAAERYLDGRLAAEIKQVHIYQELFLTWDSVLIMLGREALS